MIGSLTWAIGEGFEMPLTKKGKKIKAKMAKTYGKEKGTSVFYASINKGKIKGVEKGASTKKKPIDGIARRGKTRGKVA